MKKLILIALVTITSSAKAMQVYNPMENRWETVPSANWINQYNSMANSWSYQPQGAEVVYNSMENSWDWNSGHNFY